MTTIDPQNAHVTVTSEPKKAQSLSREDVFADGAIILRLSFQLNWVYAYVVKRGTGKCTRRRFRPEQTVKVEKLSYARA
ncbi:MAG TPA: hypothetical protein VFX60_19255 [Micromonospora sp.]|nr:hypothetical protein [Micromonospora sp.]